MFTQGQIDKILEETKPAIIESLKNEIVSGIEYQVKQDTAKMISSHVKKWVAENVLPEITQQLAESKDSLVSIGVKLGPTLCEMLVRVMTEELSERLESSWKRANIISALFK